MAVGTHTRHLLEINADRKRADQSEVAAFVHREALPLDARLERSVDGLQNIVAMRLNVKADQVGAQQSFQQFALPWTNAERLRIRPGNMPENGYARIRPSLFDQVRKQGEVIILNQHHGIFGV